MSDYGDRDIKYNVIAGKEEFCYLDEGSKNNNCRYSFKGDSLFKGYT